MIKWVCVGCNYRFDSENPSECPYCGRDSIQKEPSASDLLEEVDKLLDR